MAVYYLPGAKIINICRIQKYYSPEILFTASSIDLLAS